MSTPALLFSRQKYVRLPALLEAARASALHAQALKMVRSGKWIGDTQVPETPARYAEPHMEELLLTLLPSVETATGLRLYPTYSYLRVYKRGDVLAAHLDRPACEVSLSLSLGYEADAPWPLWIEGPAGVSPVELQPGDGVLYRGMDCCHWRAAFPGEHAAQVFLHYVDRDGAHAEWKFDKRRALRTRDNCPPVHWQY